MEKINFLRINRLFAGTVFSILLFSCDSGETTSSDGKGENTNGNNAGLNCALLAEMEEDYSQLLTKEDMASVYAIDFDKAKEDLRSGSYGEYIFSWPSDRPEFAMEMSGMKFNVPDKNTIGIKTFSYYTGDTDMKSFTETFDMGYKELSEEELERINRNLNKQEEEIKSTGEDMMVIRGKRSWEFVEGLGTSSWYKWNNQYGGELAVLAGRAKFYIIIKISDNPQENRDLARKLAEKVIAKC